MPLYFNLITKVDFVTNSYILIRQSIKHLYKPIYLYSFTKKKLLV